MEKGTNGQDAFECLVFCLSSTKSLHSEIKDIDSRLFLISIRTKVVKAFDAAELLLQRLARILPLDETRRVGGRKRERER
jgi:hypothetical protein